ncbi:MAG: hypothetical protein K6E29_05105 [Cyanobacteria bacterium RUI128]|nr:hypothetical protein [Cyanobacteria bacterium RUI128]
MKKLFALLFGILVVLVTDISVYAADKCADVVIKNRLFSVTIPSNVSGEFCKSVKKDCISIYHKPSKDAGFGGFAFGIKAYENPADHAEMPGGRKIGELTDKKGKLYDIVLKYPTDVQHDYTKSEKAPEGYKALYDLGEVVEIKGVRGSVYHKNQGMKGEDLYKDILKKHITAIKEKWDSSKLESEDMSYMYNVVAQTSRNVLDKIGYIYYDVNGDGIDELLIGEIAKGDWKGVVYDMYTMVNRKPQHVVSGGSRDRYFVTNNVFVANEYSSGAMGIGWRIYILVENSTELFPQVSFKYDAYADPESPWFVSYGNDNNDNKWENVSEQTFMERIKVFEKYIRFEYIPLSKVK